MWWSAARAIVLAYCGRGGTLREPAVARAVVKPRRRIFMRRLPHHLDAAWRGGTLSEPVVARAVVKPRRRISTRPGAAARRRGRRGVHHHGPSQSIASRDLAQQHVVAVRDRDRERRRRVVRRDLTRDGACAARQQTLAGRTPEAPPPTRRVARLCRAPPRHTIARESAAVARASQPQSMTSQNAVPVAQYTPAPALVRVIRRDMSVCAPGEP